MRTGPKAGSPGVRPNDGERLNMFKRAERAMGPVENITVASVRPGSIQAQMSEDISNVMK